MPKQPDTKCEICGVNYYSARICPDKPLKPIRLCKACYIDDLELENAWKKNREQEKGKK